MNEAPEQPPLGVGRDSDERGRSANVELTSGTIHDVFAHTGAYAVRVFGGGVRQVSDTRKSSATPIGAREITELQIGDKVLCVFLPNESYGRIICVLPSQVYDPRLVLPSSLVQRSNMGFFYDAMHYTSYQNEKLGLANFSCGRPLDAVQGDWGYINELGAAIWLGKMMAQLRATDMAKIECFWGDDLVRMFAYNHQYYTAGRDMFSFDDEGEYSEVNVWTPFIWESFGSYTPGEEVFKDLKGDAGGVKRGSEDSRFEPQEEKQSMVFRGMELNGYLGDAKREMIVLPPPDGEGIATRDDEKKFRGVLDIHHGLDGSYHVRSAKEILLSKTLMIPVPRQLLDPDDPSGDTAVGPDAEYKPANQYGSGTDQEKKPYKFPEDITDPPGRPVDLWDYQAYLFGKFGLQAIDAHEKDWETPEEADVEIDTGVPNEIDSNVITTGGSGLEFKPFAPLPEYGEVTVDQRTGHDVRYYRTRSCIHMLDDGSVSIEDGYGAQLLMSGSHIYLSCPGDVNVRPGRSFITWAPRDAIVKAGWCAEVSAAKGDVRVKAENNLHMLAGDGEHGCILLENRAEGKPDKSEWSGKFGTDLVSGGIIFKAEKSVIYNLTEKFYAGATDQSTTPVVELNAGKGELVLSGKEVGIEALTEFGIIIGEGRRGQDCVPQLSMNETDIDILSNVGIDGDVGLWEGCDGNGNLTMDGQIRAAKNIKSDLDIKCLGIMAANGMVSNSIHNGDIGNADGADVESKGGEVLARALARKDPLFEKFEDDTLDDAFTGAANQSVWDEVGFSFRLSTQYKTDGEYKVYETRGQQLYRAFGINKQWTEPIVEAPGGTPTRPHPGQETWVKGSAYQYAEPGSAENVDFTKGTAKDRESQTEEGLALTEGSMESQYAITVQE